MSNLTRIVAVVVDVEQAVFYRADGETEIIKQGDARLRPLLDKVLPDIAKQKYSDIDLQEPNQWAEFEKESNGAVRFFKIAKAKLKKFFGKPEDVEPVTPITVGVVQKPVQTQASVIDEIMQHAVPVSSPSFDKKDVAVQRPTADVGGHTPSDKNIDGVDSHFDSHSETIVAVTDKGRVIPGVERIESQFSGAIKKGSTKGMEVFLERIGKVIAKREHTVEDLLRFLERGDLPIADDGSIVIFKRLFRKDGKYVDPHTRNVVQQVGSLVYMDESLVDKNRRNECSNGLHVARRGYISSFSGDVLVLAKVRPEDVIAVPDYDANKMRVCAYHIIAELTPEQFSKVLHNRPISDAPGGAELLARVIRGDHDGIMYKTKIRGAKGSNLEFTDLSGSSKAVKAKKENDVGTKVAEVVALEAGTENTDVPVDVKQVLAKAEDETVSLAPAVAKAPTQQDIVKAMWDKANTGDTKEAQKLLDYKKKAKKGWVALGLPTDATDTLKGILKPE